MALDPSAKYPGQITTGDPGYPHGRAQNQSVEGDGTGTPLEQDLVNDIFGFQQALLDAGRLTPTNVPDKVGASQYLDAIKRQAQPLAVLTWDQPMLVAQNILPVDPASTPIVTISPNINDLATDTLVASPDGGNTWGPVTLTGTGVVFLAAAADPAGVKGIVTGSKAGGTQIQVCSALGVPLGSFSAITPPGTPVELDCALFDPNTSRFVVTGKTGTVPYIATCELADLTTWTQRTVPASITGANAALSLTRIGTKIVATWIGQTKTAYSTDGGLTWTASTTSLTSGSYVAQAGETKWVAVDSGSSRVYSSTDGIIWTAEAALARDVLAFNRWHFQFLAGVFILRCPTSAFFYYSLTNGASWVRVAEQNRIWSNHCVVRGRLITFRYLTNGSDIDVWMERSLATALP